MAVKDYSTSMPLFDRSPPLIPLNPTVEEDDKPRLGVKHLALLRVLGDHDWHTNAELCLPDVGGNRFGARMQELKDAGHPFVRERVKGGLWRYRLLDRGTITGEST